MAVDRCGRPRKLTLVVSLRCVGKASGSFLGRVGAGVGVGVAFAADAGLLKKPRILLCCFPVDAEPGPFFCVDGVLAGVFAGLGVDLLDIVTASGGCACACECESERRDNG